MTIGSAAAKKDGSDRLYGERLPIEIDDDVRDEYWATIRGASAASRRSKQLGEECQAGDRDAWRTWLKKHHASSRGVWLVYYKQDGGKARLAHDDAVDEALCFGWIDGKVRAVDDERYAQWFTSRTSDSKWSALNLERARRLLDAGAMAPAGRALAEAALRAAKKSPPPAKATGRPAAPKDLAAALDGNATARACWEAFPPSCVRQYVAWIDSAKRPETRARRVAEAIGLIARNSKKLLK